MQSLRGVGRGNRFRQRILLKPASDVAIEPAAVTAASRRWSVQPAALALVSLGRLDFGRLGTVRLSYTLKRRQGHPHKTVRIECYLAFIGTFSEKSRVIPDTSRTLCTPSLSVRFFPFRELTLAAQRRWGYYFLSVLPLRAK